MDKTYIVKTTFQAEKEIQEIIHYIAFELKFPKLLFIITKDKHSHTLAWCTKGTK